MTAIPQSSIEAKLARLMIVKHLYIKQPTSIMIIRFIYLLIFLSAVISCNSRQSDGEKGHRHTATTPLPTDTTKKSVPKELHAQGDGIHMMMHYHAPAVRNRTIWGGLVPYGEVWVSGAHNATTLEFDKSVKINGKVIPAGKYGFFTIPGTEKWIIILNSNWDQHLTDEYNSAEDVVRTEVEPQTTESFQERLHYSVVFSGKSGQITLKWEKLIVTLPFEVV